MNGTWDPCQTLAVVLLAASAVCLVTAAWWVIRNPHRSFR